MKKASLSFFVFLFISQFNPFIYFKGILRKYIKNLFYRVIQEALSSLNTLPALWYCIIIFNNRVIIAKFTSTLANLKIAGEVKLNENIELYYKLSSLVNCKNSFCALYTFTRYVSIVCNIFLLFKISGVKNMLDN